VPTRATQQEKDRMVDEFVRLCEVESPSRSERGMADAVAAELREIGLDPAEDETGAETGSDAGNVFARMPAPEGARSILLCAHLDTVPLDDRVEPVRRDGVIENRNEAILGADNKAAVAVMLAAVRKLAAEGPPIGIELLFTTCEEVALAGAKAFDLGRLRSDFGFVFDHATPIGEVIVAAPTYYRIEARFHGQAAHAGIRPEAGHNAIAAAALGIANMKLGRLDPETTANVGTIRGGTAGNVVAERCTVELEARSLDHERAGNVVSEMVDSLTQAATEGACDLELDVEELFRGYRLPKSAPPVQAACRALEELGIEPRFIPTGGGSDANAFQARGFACVNLANGTEANHQPDERVTVDALERMLDVTLATVAHSAA
jgi:tripeptide aminopeptidase